VLLTATTTVRACGFRDFRSSLLLLGSFSGQVAVPPGLHSF
jgi:hypothetical protein